MSQIRLLVKAEEELPLSETIGKIVVWSVPPGRLVGERRAEAPLPGLVPLRALPAAARRRPALARGHAGGTAVRHCGTGRRRLWNLHPGLGALQTPPKYQVRRLDFGLFLFFHLLTSLDRT